MPLPASISVEELKRVVDIQKNADDDLLELYLQAAVEQAQQPPPFGCGRRLEPSPPLTGDPLEDTADPVAVRILARGSRFVAVPDAREITELLVDGTATTSYETLERNGLIVRVELAAAPTGDGVITITGRFGFVDIPASLKDAIYVLAARWYWERAARFADQVQVGEGAVAQSYYRQLPQRTKLAFASFAVPPVIGGLA